MSVKSSYSVVIVVLGLFVLACQQSAAFVHNRLVTFPNGGLLWANHQMEGNNLDEWNEWEPPTVQIMSDLGEKFDENGISERSEKYEKANGQLPAEDELVYGRPTALTGLSPQQNKKAKDEKNGPARKQQGIKRYVGPDSLPLHIVRSGVGANGDCYFTPVSCFLLNR